MKHQKAKPVPRLPKIAEAAPKGNLDADALERAVRALALELKCSGEEIADLTKMAFRELGYDGFTAAGSLISSAELEPEWRVLLLRIIQAKLYQRILDRLDEEHPSGKRPYS